MTPLTQPSPTRAWLAWSLLLVTVGVGVALGMWGRAAAQPQLTEGQRAQAREIFQQRCATCHGGAGQGGQVPGTGRDAPPLAGRADVTAAYVDLTIRVGRMPPPGDPFDNRARRVLIDDAQRQLLVAWMAQELGLAWDVPEVGDGEAAVGQDVYAANCAHCHGNTGTGGVAGAGAWTPQVNNVDPVAIVEAIRVGPFEMPAFSTDQISDGEAAAIASFLEEVHAEQGTPVLGLVELNPVFAAAFVALLATVLVFSLLYISGRPTWFPDPEALGDAEGDTAAVEEAP